MNLLISGYYGFENQGDEWLLQGLLQGLKSIHASITVLSQNPLATAARHAVRAVSRWNLIQIFREIQRCQIFISGGGGLIQDLSGPFSPVYYLSLLAVAQSLGKKTVLVGQGFGPLGRSWNQCLASSTLKRVDRIIVRDLPSLKWCQEIGVPPERLHLGADLAWLLPAVPKSPRLRAWSICLRADWLISPLPGWVKELAHLAQARKRKLRFVALGNKGDWNFLEQLKNVPELAGCEWRDARSWTRQQLLAGSELVISMRYHGILLGAQAGALVSGLGKDPKLHYLLQDLQQPLLPETEVTKHVLCLLRQRQARLKQIQQRCQALRARVQTGIQSVQQLCQAMQP